MIPVTKSKKGQSQSMMMELGILVSESIDDRKGALRETSDAGSVLCLDLGMCVCVKIHLAVHLSIHIISAIP